MSNIVWIILLSMLVFVFAQQLITGFEVECEGVRFYGGCIFQFPNQ